MTTATDFGQQIFEAMAATDIDAIPAIEMMMKISGSLIQQTTGSDEDRKIASSMAGKWLKQGMVDMATQDAIDAAKAGAH